MNTISHPDQWSEHKPCVTDYRSITGYAVVRTITAGVEHPHDAVVLAIYPNLPNGRGQYPNAQAHVTRLRSLPPRPGSESTHTILEWAVVATMYECGHILW